MNCLIVYVVFLLNCCVIFSALAALWRRDQACGLRASQQNRQLGFETASSQRFKYDISISQTNYINNQQLEIKQSLKSECSVMLSRQACASTCGMCIHEDEFKHAKEEVERQHKRRKLANFACKQNARAKAKAKAKASSDTVPAAAASSSSASGAASGIARPSGEATRSFFGRNGESFDWKGGADERTLFHFNRSKRRGSTINGWSVVCNVHAPEVPEGSATGDARCCSRSFTADSACVALRVLKKWCLDGTVVGTKSEHCDVAHFPRDVPDDLPSHDHLDAQWQLLRPTL